MLRQIIPRKPPHIWLKTSATVLLTALALFSLRQGRISAQDFPAQSMPSQVLASPAMPAVVGRIEGGDLQVVTTTPTGVEINAAPTVVASGSDVTLRSGQALLSLDAGGEISICGPAHFKVLKSAGALTLALDYGRVHPSLGSAETFTIYTPTIIATPIPISGGPSDTTLGLEQNGEMCVLSAHGAMRVEPQFSEQSLIVPQGGTASLIGGQIEAARGEAAACSCEFTRAGVERPQTSAHVDIGVLSRPVQPEPPKAAGSSQRPPAASEPVYTVLMPALSFDANAPAPPAEPDPATILLVREVRLRPAVAFHGHVNPAPAPVPTQAAATPLAPTSLKRIELPAAQPQPGFMDHVRNMFRKLTGRAPCAGAGCNG